MGETSLSADPLANPVPERPASQSKVHNVLNPVDKVQSPMTKQKNVRVVADFQSKLRQMGSSDVEKRCRIFDKSIF